MKSHRTRSSGHRKARNRSPRATFGIPSKKFTGRATTHKLSNAARDRALKALSDMRRGDSLSKATRDNGVTIRTVKRYVSSALVQDRPGGRIRARKSDRLVRYLQIPGKHGPVEIRVRGLKQASDVARFSAAVSRYLGGDLGALKPWYGKKIGGVELIADGPAIKDLAQKELLPHSLYRAFSGGTA